ncbi:MAG: helix-turn-helix domain-containing protein [Clostridiales bacterium]|nr:helix-turn-helix domain-containing protein [Clostridiales bacterium]
MNSFGEVLNKSLEEAGISQIAAAKAAGVSRAMIYNIINLPDKALSEGKFLKMIGELPFTDAQTERLRKEYYRPKYPDGLIENIYPIREYMAGAFPDIARTKEDDFVPPPRKFDRCL